MCGMGIHSNVKYVVFFRDLVWGVITGQVQDSLSSSVLQDVREIETWILRMLSAPVPVPGRTKVEVSYANTV